MNDKVDFRFSDTDFSTYLVLKGFQYKYIEVIYDKRHSRLKAFIHFEEDKNLLLKLQEEYNSENLLVNPKQFSLERKKLNSVIKDKLNKYRKFNNIYSA